MLVPVRASTYPFFLCCSARLSHSVINTTMFVDMQTHTRESSSFSVLCEYCDNAFEQKLDLYNGSKSRNSKAYATCEVLHKKPPLKGIYEKIVA